MNSRGQAALEYLMTYGWALIVIAIVVGVLVFIVATPTNTLQCASNAPGKVNVVSNNFATTGAAGITTGSLVITNVSGGTVTTVLMTGTSMFADVQPSYTGTQTLAVGNTTLVPTTRTGTNTRGTLAIRYRDTAGLDQNASITCQGTTVVYT